MGENHADAHNVGRGGDRLTIAEAAALLGVHKNTVRNRIKNGSYRAEMVQTERGPTYLIERDSLVTNLTTNALSSASQQVVSPQAMEFVQELLRPFVSELGEAREELGAERARRHMAEERVASLETELEAFRQRQETRETVEDEPEGVPAPSAAEEAREELGTERARRKMAETTMHEGMDEERRRREEAERERDDLRRELYGLREMRESPQTAEEQQGRGEPHSATGDAQEASESIGGRGSGTARGSWWRRMFGR
jgi:excisionase family DNA binding protein